MVTNLWGHRVGWTEESTDDRLLPEGRGNWHGKSVVRCGCLLGRQP